MPSPHPSLLMLTTSYPLTPGSASGIFVKRLADALAEHCTLELICPADGAESGPTDGGIPVTKCRYAPLFLETLAHKPGGIPAALAQTPWRWVLVPGLLASLWIQTFRHARGKQGILANWSICGAIGGMVGKLKDIPVVTTLRGDDVTRAKASGPAAWILRLCMQLSDRIVLVSDAMHTAMCERFPQYRHKFVAIHNGVDSAFLNLPPPSPKPTLRLLFLGSLIPRKSVHTAIEALSQLPPNVVLHIAGEGAEKLRLQQLSKTLGVAGRVEFSGHHPPEAVPALLQGADILVLPSLSEGRPNVILEAMAAGRPVVASDIDGVRELLHAASPESLFPPGNAEAMAQSITKLINTDVRAAAGSAVRAHIKAQGLTWQNAALNYLALCREIGARNQ